jgi:carboxyl-terminal processing protease
MEALAGSRNSRAAMGDFIMKFLIQGVLAILFLTAPALRAVDFTMTQSGLIAFQVGQVLENLHYRRAPLDDTISQKFLKNYLDTLDYNHLIFLKADVEEFETAYGTKLDDLLQNPRGLTDVKPAHRIFDRYLLRLQERKDLVARLVNEKFDYTLDDSIVANRHKAEFPKDEKEAEELWRGRIKYELLSARLGKETEEDARKRIAKRYDRLQKTMQEFDNEEILQTYLESLAHVYDPHTDYMGPTEAAEFDIKHISLTLSGIGATLQWDDGYTKIVSLVPGGPAALSKKLKPNDRIIAVQQEKGEPVDVVEMRLNKVVQMIRGKRGTPVTLTIIPADSNDGTARQQITIMRDEIKLKDQFAKARIYDHKSADGKVQRLGFIELPQFYDNCAEHVEMLINRLKKENVEGLVLDLRHNGGGILEESVNLVGLFLEKGPVVQVRDVNEKKPRVYEDNDAKVAWKGPLVVLTGRLSASASEITAAALQDYGRALIVGDQTTHGKGTVQQVLDLERLLRGETPTPGKVKVTVSKFYRVAGSTTQKQGVKPDIILPSLYDYLDIGEASLENALEADSIAPATYKPVASVKQYLPDLEKNSKERIAKNKDFAYMLEDIALVKKNQEDKTISLNEKKRIEERDSAKERSEARKKERAGRVTPPDKIWDLTLETIEKNKPLALWDPKKKEEDQPIIATKADPEEEEGPDETSPTFDAQLTESLNILRDFTRLLSGAPLENPNDNVALKSPETKRATQ